MESVEVLDAVTLNRLATFKRPLNNDHFSFSPDSRSLALFTSSELISWDIQTGCRLSEILLKPHERSRGVTSFTYSKDGKMVAVTCGYLEHQVYTFNLPSRTRLGPLLVPYGQFIPPIWSHGEYLRFAIKDSRSITIWEVEFALEHPPTKVEYLPIPHEAGYADNFLFLPVLYRLASTLGGAIQVWDVKASKRLLKSELTWASGSPSKYSFSSDGRFFAVETTAREVHVWEESPAGYTLHQQPPFLLDNLERSFLSPNGRSIIFPLDGTINLWHTGDQTLSPPSPPTEEHDPQDDFLLAFSPDETSAAFAQSYGNVVTILDLQSGDLRLTIDTGMEVECLGVAEDTVIVVDEEKIATWNLPDGDRALNDIINDSVQTLMLERSSPRYRPGRSYTYLSLSPDLSHIAVIGRALEQGSDLGLEIHDVTTGTCLASTTSDSSSSLWFTRDGHEVWRMDHSLERDPRNKGWEIVEGGVSCVMKLKPLEETLYPSRAFLWHLIRGYKVTDDGWVLSPTGKRLLWLPHRWRSHQRFRIWSGRFLGLSHRLSEVVILEFFE